jgi:hypothetical protein
VINVTIGAAPVIPITVEIAHLAHGSSHLKQARAPRGQWELNMTASLTRKLRQAGLVLAIAALSATESFAYSSEAQQMCTGDAFKFCSAEIPNIPAITACMYKHRAELSPGCRAVMDKDLAAKGKKVATND